MNWFPPNMNGFVKNMNRLLPDMNWFPKQMNWFLPGMNSFIKMMNGFPPDLNWFIAKMDWFPNDLDWFPNKMNRLARELNRFVPRTNRSLERSAAFTPLQLGIDKSHAKPMRSAALKRAVARAPVFPPKGFADQGVGGGVMTPCPSKKAPRASTMASYSPLLLAFLKAR
jgi:hypothetical protein